MKVSLLMGSRFCPTRPRVSPSRCIGAYTSVVKWRIVLEQDPEAGEFAAWCPELAGCVSAGVTEADAESKLSEAILLYMEQSPLDQMAF